ncbi:hypothetical protein Tco_0098892 [Tanacetum coccineum]
MRTPLNKLLRVLAWKTKSRRRWHLKSLPQGMHLLQEPPQKWAWRRRANANAPPKVLRKEHDASRPTQSALGGKSLASMGLETGSTFSTPAPQEASVDVSDQDPVSYARPESIPVGDIAQATVAGDPDSKKSSSFTSLVGSPNSIFQPGWGVTNNCRLDTSNICLDVVDHIVPPGYFSELRHLPNDDFLGQYNINLARQVALGSQLRLRFEQEIRLQKRATKSVARRDQRIQAREEEIQKLEQEINALRVVGTEHKTFGIRWEFKKYKDERESIRCAEMDARLDALSIDFDEELYPHMLTAIAGRRWVMGHGLRLAMLKCAESLELSYDPKAEAKFMATMQALKDLKYPLIDELEKLKDAPMDIIMASLHLESDTGEDAPQWICDLRPSSSQLKIPVYPEVGWDSCLRTTVPQGLQILLKDAAV